MDYLKRNLTVLAASLFTGLLFLYTVLFYYKIPLLISFFTVIFIFFLFYTAIQLWKKSIWNDNQMVLFIITTGFMIRLVYILFMNIYTTQNDAGSFECKAGHLGYIWYLYNNVHLPDFDPRTLHQFWHPPLHHILAAIFLKITTTLGFSINQAAEGIQLLTLTYSLLILIFFDKILVKLGIKHLARISILFTVTFMPYLITMAGAVNNDELCLLFMIICIYYVIVWYEKPTLKNIIIIAVSLGLAMSTKLSGGLIAPAIAVVFLYKMRKERSSIACYIKQYSVFAIIVFPLGLWWYIRNKVLFDVPFSFVYYIPKENDLYIGDYSISQRLFGITSEQMQQLSICFSNKDVHCDYTIPLSVLKYLTFNESSYYLHSDLSKLIGQLLFFFVTVLSFTMIIISIYALIKSNAKFIWKLFCSILITTITIQFIKFCFDFPHICTMNVRYILFSILTLLILGGFGLDTMYSKDGLAKKSATIIFHTIIAGSMISILSTLVCIIVSK